MMSSFDFVKSMPFALVGDAIYAYAVVMLLNYLVRAEKQKFNKTEPKQEDSVEHDAKEEECPFYLSAKMQLLKAIAFLTRFSDLVFISPYHLLGKAFLVVTSWFIYLLMVKKCAISNKRDTFPVWLMVAVAAGGAALLHRSSVHEFSEVMWTFSYYVEVVAVVPQLFLLETQKSEGKGVVDGTTKKYLWALVAYRTVYIVNWIYRFVFEGRMLFASAVAGSLQWLLLLDAVTVQLVKPSKWLKLMKFPWWKK